MVGQAAGATPPSYADRREFLHTVRYEAQRAGLDPELVLGLIQVESGFRRYAVSRAGARGYMQVMPFWTEGDRRRRPTALFDMVTNIRYGCVILRHYLDLEKGNLFLALGRYNGSRGRDTYPKAVLAAWQRWKFAPPGSRQPPARRQRATGTGSRPAPRAEFGAVAEGATDFRRVIEVGRRRKALRIPASGRGGQSAPP